MDYLAKYYVKIAFLTIFYPLKAKEKQNLPPLFAHFYIPLHST